MTKRILILAVVMLCVCGTAYAESVGLIPAAVKKEPKVDEGVATRDLDLPVPKAGVPSNIIGLEGYQLFGDRAGAVAAITGKRRIGQWRDTTFNAGALIGVVTAGEEQGDATYLGGFVEADVRGLAGLVLVVRFDDGIAVNPGFRVTLLGVSF